MIKWSTHLERHIHSWIVASWEDKADPKWYPSHTSSEGMENHYGLSIFLVEGHKCPAQDKNNLYFIVGCTSKYYIVIHRNTIYILFRKLHSLWLLIVFLVMTNHSHRWLHQYLVGHHLSKFMIVDKIPSCDAKRLQNKQPAWNNRFPGKLKQPRLHHTTIHGQIHGYIPYAWSYPPSNITYQISTKMFGYAHIIPMIPTKLLYCLASTMVALNSFSQNANRNYYPSGPIIVIH